MDTVVSTEEPKRESSPSPPPAPPPEDEAKKPSLYAPPAPTSETNPPGSHTGHHVPLVGPQVAAGRTAPLGDEEMLLQTFKTLKHFRASRPHKRGRHFSTPPFLDLFFSLKDIFGHFDIVSLLLSLFINLLSNNLLSNTS